MIHVFIRHTVHNYVEWRETFVAAGPTRRLFGTSSSAVYQSIDDPNDVTVVLEFDDWQTARRYVASDELKKTMAEAGVRGQPTVWYTEVDSLAR